MRKLSVIAAAAAVVFAVAGTTNAQHISGDYVETRSADVYTGSCFANAEVNLVGNEAILAWRVDKGEWDGQKLDGLSVVGVVKASGTLGDPYENPYPANSVLIVDQNGDAAQRAALVSFAQSMGGALLKNAVRVEVAPIKVDIERHGEHVETATVHAGDVAGIQTRMIGAHDHICGNEETYYPPLTDSVHAMAAVAVTDQYRGPDLGVVWTLHNKRSAFVGTFAR